LDEKNDKKRKFFPTGTSARKVSYFAAKPTYFAPSDDYGMRLYLYHIQASNASEPRI
jgi:hypothetical protein